MYHVLGTYSGDSIISSYIKSGKLMRFSSPGLVFICGEAIGAIYLISEHGCTYSFKIQTVSVLSFIQVF